MTIANVGLARVAAIALAMLMACGVSSAISAETQVASEEPASEAEAPEPLSADELEVLVARIALYPDELVAVISEASLYPLQIVEAARFLDKLEKDKNLKPKEDWDGSVISLLNYPDVVRMMSDDLDWTQSLGDALTYQQKDVLIAIQQLRDEAVAKGIIKSDEKIQVVESSGNVVIQPTVAETIYVPQYEPQMLYAPDYPPEPISYYPEPYPSYYYPTAGFFAGAVTGVLWGAAMDWDNWDVWGGGWDGGDLDIDCNNCFNNIKGKVNWKDVDWKNVDRSKINFDRNQLANFDRTKIKDGIKADRGNSIRSRAAEVKRERPGNLAGRTANRDIRKSALGDQKRLSADRPGAGAGANAKRPNAGADKRNFNKQGGVNRPSGKPKAGARVDRRPSKPSGLGNVDRGKRSQVNSNRGRQSMGGGAHGGQRAVKRSGGHRTAARSGGHRPQARSGGNRGGGGGRRGGGGGRRR